MTKEERIKIARERYEKLLSYDKEASHSYELMLAGIDEVGRGPLAGPVVAACVVLPADFDGIGIYDSKKVTEKSRTMLDAKIREHALAYGIGVVDNELIDQINILNATKEAMRIAYKNANKMLEEKEGKSIDILLIDALTLGISKNEKGIIKGDENSLAIAASSILAKVYRDKLMIEEGKKYPDFAFESNKGYGSKSHIEALKEYGPTPIHRRSFIGRLVK